MDDQGQDGPFDRSLRRLRRDRAATAPGNGDYLHRRAAEDLIDRLDLVTRGFERALDLSSGPARLTQILRARGIDVVGADAGARFAARIQGLQCDEDRIPLAEHSVDLVVSVGALDSVNDLPGALVLIRKILKPDGLFLAAFTGAGSLPRLRDAMRAADEAESGGVSPRIHPQIDLRTAGDLLGRAGFALPVVDSDTVSVRFSSLWSLVRDLRSMGGTNLLRQRAMRPIGRRGRAAAEARFAAAADPDGKTAERFEIIHLSGWAPAPSQPQPARRGSATASLADALKKKDRPG